MVTVGESVFCARSGDICEVVARSETELVPNSNRPERVYLTLLCSGCGEPLGEEGR